MERGRTELLRALGFSQGEIMAGKAGEVFGFAVRAMSVEFLKPARMDDLLTIETRADAIGGASMDLDQRVLRGDEVLITAKVRIACVANGKPARIPKAVREALGG
jgi:acyl-CoA thioester hydrolase